jgi:DNA-binding NarL/FixJ family response regulator
VGAGETLLPLDEVEELRRFATGQREQERLDRRAIEPVTRREREVLNTLAEGRPPADVAADL